MSKSEGQKRVIQSLPYYKMGACCSKIAKMFSGADVAPDQQTNLEEPLVRGQSVAGRENSKRSIVTEYTSSSNEFVPIDEEWQGKDDELYMGSYWWAKAKGDNGMGELWDKMGGDATDVSSDNIEAQQHQQDIDPYGRYPSFSVNIRHPNKPVSSKLAAAAKEAAKKGPRKPKKIVVDSESDDEIFRKSILDVFDYDPDEMVSLYPIIKEGDLPPPGVDDKCTRINNALSLTKKERDKKLIDVYATLNVIDREYVPQRYEEMFGINLRREMSRHLKGDFGKLIEYLSVPIIEAEVIMIDNALKLRIRDNYLSRILCGRTNEEIKMLKEKYREINHRSLDDSVFAKLGTLTSLGPYYRLCFEGIVEKYEPKSKHKKNKADDIAQQIWDAGEGKWGTDTAVFLNLLCSTPAPLLRQVNQAYQKNHKSSINRAIINELIGSNEIAVLYGVGMYIDPWLTVSKAIYALYKGLGMDALGVNMMIVRYEPYLKHVCAAYESKYRETLHDRIEHETIGTGSYHDLLERIYYETNPNLKNGGIDNKKNKKNIPLEELYDNEKLLPIYPNLTDEPPSTLESKCTKIKDALRFAPFERDSMLINIFGKLSLEERAYIAAKYKEMHGIALSKQMDVLEGHFRELVVLISLPSTEAETIMLVDAFEKKDQKMISRFLCGRQNEEILIIKENFAKATGKSLEETIEEKIKAGTFATYLGMCIQGVVEVYDPKGKHTDEKAEQVAKDFYDAGEGQWVGGDTKTMLDIITRSPPPFLQAVEKYYTENYKSNIKKVVKAKFTFMAEYSILYGAEMALHPFRFVGRSLAKAFAGTGMNHDACNGLFVRYTLFLRPISMALSLIHI